MNRSPEPTALRRKARIVVVGTFAMGVTIRTPRLPQLGETLHGDGLAIGYGGKGSNQAIACARLGAEVELVTCVGRDVFGDQAFDLYRAEGVGTTGVLRDEALPTGLGAILVEPDGGNAIVVDIGANRKLTASVVDGLSRLWDRADAVATVTEAPIDAVAQAIEVSRRRSLLTVLNPAPAVTLSDATLRSIGALTPNRAELETLTGRTVSDIDSARKAAEELLARGVRSVAVTLGADGALLCERGRTLHVPAPRVSVVDTTGAGDAFTAGLTVFSAEGLDIERAVRLAVCCGSLACTKREVVPSLPTRAEVMALYERGFGPVD